MLFILLLIFFNFFFCKNIRSSDYVRLETKMNEIKKKISLEFIEKLEKGYSLQGRIFYAK